MKTNYNKVKNRSGEYVYSNIRSGYFRRVRTFGELREYDAMFHDDDLNDLKVYPRRRRNKNLLDAWNDFPVSRDWKKSWKDYTKHSKQWEVGFDPGTEERRVSTLEARLLRMIEALSS